MLNQWIAAALPGGLLERQINMNHVTVVGTGPVARGLAVRLLQGRCQVRILGNDAARVSALVRELGADAEGGSYGSTVEGTMVALAVPFGEVEPFVRTHGSQLDGKIVIDISNPVGVAGHEDPVARSTPGSERSTAERIDHLLRGRAHVVKAFSTVSAEALHRGEVAGVPLDVFLAGDCSEATSAVSRLVINAGMRPIDCGPLRHSRELEAMMVMLMSVQTDGMNTLATANFALKLLP